jgi:hypothetical protein
VFENSIPFLENTEDSDAEEVSEALDSNGERVQSGEVSEAPKRKRHKNMDDEGIEYSSKDCEPYFPKGEVREIMRLRWYEPAENGVFEFNEGEKFDNKKQYLLNANEIPIQRFVNQKVFIPEDDPSIYVVGPNKINGLRFNFNNKEDRDKYSIYWLNNKYLDRMVRLGFEQTQQGIKDYTEAVFLQPYEDGIWEGYLHRPLNRHDLHNYLEYLISNDPSKPKHYTPILVDMLLYDTNGEVVVDKDTGHLLFKKPNDITMNMSNAGAINAPDAGTMNAPETKKVNVMGRGVVSASLRDHYTTPEWCIEKLVPILFIAYGSTELTIYDPCCGSSRMIGSTLQKYAMEDYNVKYKIIEDDLHYHPDKKNYLLNDSVPQYDILITNPPFSGKNKLHFLVKAYQSKAPWILLLPLQVLVPVDNMRLFNTYGIRIYLLTPSPRFLDENGIEKSIRECGWFFWDGNEAKNSIQMEYLVKKSVKKGCHCSLHEYVDYFQNVAKEFYDSSHGGDENTMNEDDNASKSENSVLDVDNQTSNSQGSVSNALNDMTLQSQESENIEMNQTK